MKPIQAIVILVLFSFSVFAADIKTGDDLINAMHKKYDGKWYKTLTFKQITTTYKPDGSSHDEVWYEALNAPGRLRIDFDPVEKGNGILFADGKLYSYKDGKLADSRAFVHPLLVLGFDVYMQPVATTIAQLKGMTVDMSRVHQEDWMGRKVYVVGAKQGDLAAPQFWIDKKDLLFVRLIELGGKDRKSVRETQFNKYKKAKGGGWVSAEVQFFVDGKKATTEAYSEIQTGMNLSDDLWKPEKWMMADRTYTKKK